jgi:hypothetical protein
VSDEAGTAKDALLALLAGNTWPGVQPETRYGQPTEGEDAPFAGEVMFLGETRENEPFVGLGGRSDASFNLRFVIDVRHEGDDERTTEQRARELKKAAYTLLKANTTLSGTVQRITGFEATQVNVPEPQAWRTQIVVDVAAVAAPIT